MTDHTDMSSISLSKQLEACDGQRLLLGLLTSPSASINLAGGKSHVSGGLRELRTTASVQGMSSRQVRPVSQSVSQSVSYGSGG